MNIELLDCDLDILYRENPQSKVRSRFFETVYWCKFDGSTVSYNWEKDGTVYKLENLIDVQMTTTNVDFRYTFEK